MNHPQKNRVIVIDQALIKSKVWLSLNGVSKDVFLLFRCKCRFEKFQVSKNRRRTPELSNNGEIVFTYDEALKKYGITNPRFKRAIDELIEKGFIDIAATGQGTFKVVTLYSISERWRAFGTPDFIESKRPKRNTGYPGFKKGNELYQRRTKTKSTDENIHDAMNENVHDGILAMYNNVHGEKIKNLYKWSNDKWLSFKIA